MKRLLLLGGFPQMTDIVSLAHEMGIFVIVVDKEPTSPAKKHADKSFDISTNNVDAIENLCRVEGVDGVFTGFEDFNIHIACELCERLGLPFYATKEQLEIVTDKERFKKKCQKYNIPVIEQYEYKRAIASENFPYIVKPSDSYGSRGITVCGNKEELNSGYLAACSTSRTGRAVIEQYIDYDHGVELFYTIVNNNIHLTATADRYTVKVGGNAVPLPVAEVFPSKHRKEMIQRLDPAIRKMLSGLKLQNGLVLIQALFDGKNYFINEMAYRLSGEQHYCIVARQKDINLGKMMIKLALGEDISEYDTELIDDVNLLKPSINQAVVLNSGKIEHISGLEKIKNIKEVIDCILARFDGDVVSTNVDYSHILTRIMMVAENYSKLHRAVSEINNYVKVVSSNGEDMIAMRFELPEGE